MAPAPRHLPPHRADLLSREVGDGFVVVDEAAEQAHELSGDVATVWRAAGDGNLPELPQQRVTEIVAELIALGLLEETDGLTRRAMIQRGGAVVALAGLATVALPEAAAFASTIVNPSTPQTADGTVTLTASSTNFIRNLVITLKGGAGGAAGAGGTAVAGGNGAELTITFPNRITSNVTLTWIIGGAATAVVGGTASVAALAGGAGGTGTGTGAAGGGGGAASRLVVTGGATGTIFAGGGGGASGGTTLTAGGSAGGAAPTTVGASSTPGAGAAGGSATGASTKGGGGGAGAGAPAGTAGLAGGGNAAGTAGGGGTSAASGLTSGATVTATASSTAGGSISYSYVQGP